MKGRTFTETSVKVNPTNLAKAGDETAQAGYLFHEYMHLYFGQHDASLDYASPVRDQLDPTYACQALCFGTKTRCNCARCIGRSECDPMCKKYPACDPKPSICSCDQRPWPTTALCNVNCQSSVKCFAAACTDPPACK